jgi:hypothetical protein
MDYGGEWYNIEVRGPFRSWDAAFARGVKVRPNLKRNKEDVIDFDIVEGG